jgi:hypothetical protein
MNDRRESADELLRRYRQTQAEIRRLEELERVSPSGARGGPGGALAFMRARLEHHRAQGMRARTAEIARADLRVGPFTFTALADEERYEQRFLSRNAPYLE